jgi:hypothetical protein
VAEAGSLVQQRVQGHRRRIVDAQYFVVGSVQGHGQRPKTAPREIELVVSQDDDTQAHGRGVQGRRPGTEAPPRAAA